MTRPRYVRRGGDLVLGQPIRNNHCRSFTWFLDADWDRLAALTRTAFTEPSGGAVEVRPLLPLVAIVCADIARGQSMVPIDRDKGWARERDLGFWVPVARGTDDRGTFRIDQIGWYHPYLFVDNAAGTITGRETYGFTKCPAICHIPMTPDDPAKFAVETLVFEEFGFDEEAKVRELFRLTRTGDGVLGTLESTFDNLGEAAVKVLGRLTVRAFQPGGLPVPTLTLLKNLYDQVTEGLVPMLFLKQFRAVEDAEHACYQAIIEGACDLEAWHGGGFLDEQVLSIHHAASHPIATDLGLSASVIETGWGFWAEYDFVVKPGKVLWEAVTSPP